MVRIERLLRTYLLHKEHSQGRSTDTVDKYGSYLRRLAAFLGERVLEATSDDPEAFTGLHLHKAGLSPRSRRAVVAAVRGFYRWLREKGHIPVNPAEALPYPVAGLRLPVPMALDAAQKLMMAPDTDRFTGLRDAAMFALLIGCGLRLSGLVGLNQSDLMFFEDDKGREHLVVKVREKGRKERLVPAPPEARLLLHAYLGHPALEAIDRSLPSGDLVLFITTRNRLVAEDKYHGEARRISARTVQELIERYGERAGIPRAQRHAHAARHLYGAELAEEDVDVLTRQALMGHSDPRSTEIYTQLAMRKLTKAAEKANPLRKIHTPVTDLKKELERRARSTQ